MNDLHAFARCLVESVAAHDPGALGSPIAVGEIMGRMMPYRACRSALGLETAEEYELLLLRLVAEQRGLARTFPPESAERCRVEVMAVLPDLGFLRELEEVTILLDLNAIAAAPVRPKGSPESERATEGPGEIGPTEKAGEPADAGAGEAEASAESGHRDGGEPARPAEDSPPGEETIDPLDFDPEAEGLEAFAPEQGADPGAEPLGHEYDSSEFAIPPAAPTAGAPLYAPATAPPVVRWETPAPPAGPGEAPRECPQCDRTLPHGRPVRFCPSCGQNVLVRLCRSCRAEMEPDWRHCVMCGHPSGESSHFA